jgi:hypothetical protein
LRLRQRLEIARYSVTIGPGLDAKSGLRGNNGATFRAKVGCRYPASQVCRLLVLAR